MTPLQQELALPAYAGLSDQAAAAALNAPIVVGHRLVPLAEFVYRLFTDATWATLAAAAGGAITAPPAPLTAEQVQAAARTAYDYFRNPHVLHIDMDMPAVQQMCAVLVAVGVLSEAMIEEINGMANVIGTRWRQLKQLGNATPVTIFRARRNAS